MAAAAAAAAAAPAPSRPHVLTLPFVYNRVVSFLSGAADLPAVGALVQTERACLQAFLADEQSDGQIKRVFDTTCARASAADVAAPRRSRLLFGRALAAWPHLYNPATPSVLPTHTPWRGRTHHDAWSPRLLVSAAEETRVHTYNGQTLRTRGGGIVAVGRRAGSYFSVDSGAGTRADPVQMEARVVSDPKDPITQVAVYGDTVYTVQRSGKGKLLRAGPNSSGGGCVASEGDGGVATAAAPAPLPLRPLGRVKLAKEERSGIRRVFGSDFIDGSTLLVGTCNTWGGRTGVNNRFQEFKVTESAVVPSATWDCTRSPADGANLQGSLLVPTFAHHACASVTTSSVRVFDVRQRALALRFPILRTTMGPNGPARAQFGHESTYLAMLHDAATHVYDVRRTPELDAPGAAAISAAPRLARKLSRAHRVPVEMPFVAGRKPMCLCWMPVATGFQIATSVSTGEILVHDVSRNGFHVGTLFPGGADKSPTTSVQCWEEGLVAQSANGAVRLLYGRTSSVLSDEGGGFGNASSCPIQ